MYAVTLENRQHVINKAVELVCYRDEVKVPIF